ncbi:uncharacterized protein IUM83_18247 [Phytophthora cinnamomi]|uniref:uncharacterized protein n=1 Tax=Phytophthora cinnamomi TaxID=4785 RepID=UPI00355A113C|nr:hypothetical protein IUM83_18247 [Phytophthora cinnamomi]
MNADKTRRLQRPVRRTRAQHQLMRTAAALCLALVATPQGALGLRALSSTCERVGERPVRVEGVSGTFCVPLRPCEGPLGNASDEPLFCPRAGQRDVAGDEILAKDSCCAVVDSRSGLVGCVVVEGSQTTCLPSAEWPQAHDALGSTASSNSREDSSVDASDTSDVASNSKGSSDSNLLSSASSQSSSVPTEATSSNGVLKLTPITDDSDKSASALSEDGSLSPANGGDGGGSSVLGTNTMIFIIVGSVAAVALMFGVFYLRPARANPLELLTPREPPPPMDRTGAYPYDNSLESDPSGPYDASSTPRAMMGSI